MSMHKCSFKNCTNVDRKSNCRFFHYPIDQEKCRQWIELSGNDSLYKLNKSKLGKVKVCSAHFQIDQMLGSGRLQTGSLPSPYQRSPNNTNNISLTGTASATASGPSTANIVSQSLPELDTIPPFIIVHEIVEVTIDLIDEDEVPDYAGIIAKAEYNIDDENVSLLEEEDHGSDIITLPGHGELEAATGPASNTRTSNIKNNLINLAAETPDILQERDPLAIEVEDNPSSNAARPLLTSRFAESDTAIFKDIGRNRPNNLETTDNGEIPTLMKDAGLDKHVRKNCSRADETLEILEESDPLAMDVDDNPSSNAPVILKRLIDSVCLLAKLNIPFRNCADGNSSLLHGSYLAIIKGLSEYDQLLKQQLEAPNVYKFTSSTIQDGLITAVKTVLVNKIKQEVKGSKFVSIILCRTSETVNGSQLSVVLQYVDKEGVIQERFIGYKDVGSGSALFENMLKHVAQVITVFKIQDKLVALSYSGPLAELCIEIKQQYPRVLIMNNQFENQLSSIFQRAYSNIKEFRLYVATMTDMTKFFSSESNVKKLNFFIRSKFQNSSSFQFFKCLEKSLCLCLPQVFAFFKDMIENPKNWSGETVLKAQGYLCFFEDFSNIFLLVTLERVFALTTRLDRLDPHGLSNSQERFDKELRDFLKEEGNNFFRIWEDVKKKRTQCNLEPEPVQMKRKKVYTYSRKQPEQCNLQPEPVQMKRKNVFTYSQKQSELEDPKYHYRQLFKKITSSFTGLMDDHLSFVRSLQFNDLLNLSNAAKYRSTFPIESFEVLQKTYPGILNWIQLKCQLATLYRLLEFKDIPPLELMPLMKMYDVENVMPEVYTLACLCSTIPATSPSKEISNSAIQRIKNLSETLGQRQMSNLTLLSIENNFLTQLKKLPNFYSEVLDEFADK